MEETNIKEKESMERKYITGKNKHYILVESFEKFK